MHVCSYISGTTKLDESSIFSNVQKITMYRDRKCNQTGWWLGKGSLGDSEQESQMALNPSGGNNIREMTMTVKETSIQTLYTTPEFDELHG